jgi:hypothetical protein
LWQRRRPFFLALMTQANPELSSLDAECAMVRFIFLETFTMGCEPSSATSTAANICRPVLAPLPQRFPSGKERYRH